MRKKIFAKSLDAAETIYDSLCIKSNCFDHHGTVVRADCIVALDDDATSALWAAWLYHKIRKQHGYYPTILCVGGKGLLSKYTHEKSEAELLKYVCLSLGVSDVDITLAPNGKNTGENIQAVKKLAPKGETVIWSVTKRLSLRVERTVALQAPEINSFYYVIEERLSEAAKFMNGKCLAHLEPMFHELASILQRCQRYAGVYQAPIPTDAFYIHKDLRKADAYLRKHYKLKTLPKQVSFCGLNFNLPDKNPYTLWQALRIILSVKKHKKDIKRSLEIEIFNMLSVFQQQGLMNTQKIIDLQRVTRNRIYAV